MKRLGKIISTVLAASMFLSNAAYAGELADTDNMSAGAASFFAYIGDKISNTIDNVLSDASLDNETSDESEVEEFQDPGMELGKDDILQLYNMGYELDDIEEAVKLSSVQNKTPYELLQAKGKTKYIPHEIETTEQMNTNSVEGENINVQPEYDFTVDERSWSDVLIELNGVDTNIDENQWEFIKLSGIDKYIDESMLTDEEKTKLSSIDLNSETETRSVAEASTNTDFEDIYNNNIFPNSVHEITQQGAYSTYNDVAVNDLTGNVVVSATDVSLPGRNGLDLNLTRYYSAIDAAHADASVYKERGSYSNQIVDYYAVIVHPYVTITYNQPLADGSTTQSFYADRVFIAPDRVNYNHYPDGTSMFKCGMFVSEEAFNEQLQRMYDEGEVPSYMFTDANCEETCKSYARSGYYDYTIKMPAESKISKIEYEIEEDMIDSTAYPDCEVTVWNNSYYDDINEPIHEKYFQLGAGWSFDFPYIEKRYDSNEYVTYEYLHMGSSGVWQIEDNQIKDYYLNDMQLESGSGSVNGESCEYTLTQKDGKKYYFGTLGQLLQIKDRYDNTISYEYNIIADGRFDYPQLKKITDTVGRTVDISYSTDKVTITVTDKNDSSQNRVIEYTKGKLGSQSILSSVKDGQGYITNYEYYTDTFEVSMLDKKFTSDCSEIDYALLSAVNYPNGLRTAFTYSGMKKNCGISGVMEVPICAIVEKYDYNIDLGDYNYRNTSEIRYSMQNGFNNTSFVYDGYPTFRGINEVPDEYRTYTYIKEKTDRYNSVYKETTTTYHASDNDTLLKESVTINCDISRSDDQESKYQTSVTDYVYNTEDLCTKETTRYYNDYETDKDTYVTTTKQYTYDSGKYGDLLSVKINDNNNYKTEYTYDSTYHLPLTTTYKKDTNSTIVERNELTSDKKSVASLTVTDNNSTKLKREYTYDGYGNVTTEKRYIGNGNWSDYAEITYNYEDSRNVSNKINGVLVLCQDNGHIKPLLFGKISKMHNVVAFIPRFA